ALRRYDWPGNVRELKLALHRALALSDGHAIDAEHIVFDTEPRMRGSIRNEEPVCAQETLAQRQENAIRDALKTHDGNVSAAARELGVARSTIYRVMKRRRH
ncbi:MAG: helix-turn-helix domain-containing protein, partial [Myxococcota bacterium]